MSFNRADVVLRCIERSAKARYLPIVGSERGKILGKLVRKFKPRRILEVGTLVGYSTILMAQELGSEAEIVTIEIDEDEVEIARENIRKAEVRPSIMVLIGDALEIIPCLEGVFDLVFLDAAKSEYYTYLKLVEDKTHKGSVLVADNVRIFTSSMMKYLDRVRCSGEYKSRFIAANGDGMEISTRL